MKKLLFFTAGLFLCFNVTAQETKFGVTAGYSNLSIKGSYQNISASVNSSGFYVGALADISFSDAFHIQPGVNYGLVEESNWLFVPVMAKYYIGDSNFNVQGGPQATFILEEVDDGTNSFGLDIVFGAGYDITENFFLEAKYALELTNRVKGEFDGGSKPHVGINTFTAGVGYKF